MNEFEQFFEFGSKTLDGEGGEVTTVTPLGKVYTMDSIESVRELISDLPVSGMYGTKNAENEDVIVFRELGHGINIQTFQNNGWISISAFTEDGRDDGQWFDGRWE